MKRTMTVLFALALLVAFSGSAMATPPAEADNALLKAAVDKCKAGSNSWFDVEQARKNQLLVMPYAAAADPDGFRTGIALINTGSLDKDNIVSNSLCIVGVKKDGTSVAKIYPSRIVSGAIVTEVVDLIGSGWDDDMIISVFQNRHSNDGNTDVRNPNLDGFYITGDGTQAQGSFALRGSQNGTDKVQFNYVPGEPFVGGVAIFNNDASSDASLKVYVTYSDGMTHELTAAADQIKIDRGKMILGNFETIIDGFDPSKAAQIRFENTADQPESLFAFTFFGDGAQAYGYSSPAP